LQFIQLYKKLKTIYNMESKGLGDSIAKFTEATGIAKAVETVTHAAGIQDCGCKKRQEQLNNLFPYNNAK
jgi:hypothetical protein